MASRYVALSSISIAILILSAALGLKHKTSYKKWQIVDQILMDVFQLNAPSAEDLPASKKSKKEKEDPKETDVRVSFLCTCIRYLTQVGIFRPPGNHLTIPRAELLDPLLRTSSRVSLPRSSSICTTPLTCVNTAST